MCSCGTRRKTTCTSSPTTLHSLLVYYQPIHYTGCPNRGRVPLSLSLSLSHTRKLNIHVSIYICLCMYVYVYICIYICSLALSAAAVRDGRPRAHSGQPLLCPCLSVSLTHTRTHSLALVAGERILATSTLWGGCGLGPIRVV